MTFTLSGSPPSGAGPDPCAFAGMQTNVGKLRVLIIDDNVDAATSMKTLLSLWGFCAKVAHSGAEALEIAEEFRPKVVLLDLGLPDKHGYEVAKALRIQAKQRRLYFVAVTGWAHVADQVQSTAAGVSHHLVKPANPDILREILNAYQAAEDTANSVA